MTTITFILFALPRSKTYHKGMVMANFPNIDTMVVASRHEPQSRPTPQSNTIGIGFMCRKLVWLHNRFLENLRKALTASSVYFHSNDEFNKKKSSIPTQWYRERNLADIMLNGSQMVPLMNGFPRDVEILS